MHSTVNWQRSDHSPKEARRRQRQLREENLRKRVELFARCETDPVYRAAVLNILRAVPQEGETQLEAVIRGCLFYFEYFAWTYNPREKLEYRIQPMVLYREYQPDIVIHMIKDIERTLGTDERSDTLFEKSRDMGLSWIVYHVAIYYMLYRDGNILVGSNTVADLDKIDDLGTPFEKMRLQLRQMFALTPWALPADFNPNTDMPECIIRLGEGRQILGKASTANFGRGPRCTFIIIDEYQSWECAEPAYVSCSYTSQCRFIIGTPLGPNNHYARLARGETDDDVFVYRVHWTNHPLKAAGLEYVDGKPSSPWYRIQVKKFSPELVASEIDIKYDVSTKAHIFYDFLEIHRVKHLEPVDDGSRIIRIWDPGLTFAVLFIQVDRHGRVLVLREEIFEHAEIHNVASEIVQISQEDYGDFDFDDPGDPAGGTRVNSSQTVPEYEVLQEYDIFVDYYFIQEMAPKTRVKARIQAIHNKLRELCTSKSCPGPAFLIDETKCPKLVEALSEKYRWKLDRITKEALDVVAEVHPYEDVVDCLGYGLLYKFGVGGTGGGNRSRRTEVEKGSVSWDRPGMNRTRRRA